MHVENIASLYNLLYRDEMVNLVSQVNERLDVAVDLLVTRISSNDSTGSDFEDFAAL